jgi:ZIP family zinc transporter
MAFAAGALIVSTSFELFEPAYADGGPWRAGLAFAAGATTFVVADTWLEACREGRPVIALSSAAGFIVGYLLRL